VALHWTLSGSTNLGLPEPAGIAGSLYPPGSPVPQYGLDVAEALGNGFDVVAHGL
jgi:hypothetical protein